MAATESTILLTGFATIRFSDWVQAAVLESANAN